MDVDPSIDSRRAEELLALLPEAQSSYEKAESRVGLGEILYG